MFVSLDARVASRRQTAPRQVVRGHAARACLMLVTVSSLVDHARPLGGFVWSTPYPGIVIRAVIGGLIVWLLPERFVCRTSRSPASERTRRRWFSDRGEDGEPVGTPRSLPVPPRGGGRESNPPASSRPHTGLKACPTLALPSGSDQPPLSSDAVPERAKTCQADPARRPVRRPRKTCPATPPRPARYPREAVIPEEEAPILPSISGTSPRLDGIEWGCCPR